MPRPHSADMAGPRPRGISREVLARNAVWTLADGACKDMTIRWSTWEDGYLRADALPDRAVAVVDAAAVCAGCSIVAECADLAALSRYTGIAAGRGYRNGRPDTYRQRDTIRARRRSA